MDITRNIPEQRPAQDVASQSSCVAVNLLNYLFYNGFDVLASAAQPPSHNTSAIERSVAGWSEA
jgi:hypothetical protein